MRPLHLSERQEDDHGDLVDYALRGRNSVDALLRLARGTVHRVRRWRASLRPAQQVRVLHCNAYLYVNNAEAADLNVTLYLVNFWDRPVEVDQVRLEHWRIGGHSMAQQSAILRAHGHAGRRSVGTGHFSVSLGPADVRTLVRAIGPAQNTKSTPDARLELSGLVRVLARRTEVLVPFRSEQTSLTFSIPNALLSLGDA